MYILLLVRLGLFFYTLYTALDGNMWNWVKYFPPAWFLESIHHWFFNLVNLNWALETPVVELRLWKALLLTWETDLCVQVYKLQHWLIWICSAFASLFGDGHLDLMSKNVHTFSWMWIIYEFWMNSEYSQVLLFSCRGYWNRFGLRGSVGGFFSSGIVVMSRPPQSKILMLMLQQLYKVWPMG